MDRTEIDDEDSAPAPRPDASLHDGRRCKYCGSPMESGDQLCLACGTHVTGRYPTFSSSEMGRTQPARTRTTPSWLVIVSLILFLVTLARTGVFHNVFNGSNSDGPPPNGLHSISGTLLLTMPGAHWDDRCAGGSMVHAGVPVAGLNLERTPLATAPLQGGTANRSDECEFVFTLTDVPETDTYYFMVAGQQIRVPLPYGHLAGKLDWKIRLTATDHSRSETPVPLVMLPPEEAAS